MDMQQGNTLEIMSSSSESAPAGAEEPPLSEGLLAILVIIESAIQEQTKLFEERELLINRRIDELRAKNPKFQLPNTPKRKDVNSMIVSALIRVVNGTSNHPHCYRENELDLLVTPEVKDNYKGISRADIYFLSKHVKAAKTVSLQARSIVEKARDVLLKNESSNRM